MDIQAAEVEVEAADIQVAVEVEAVIQVVVDNHIQVAKVKLVVEL